MAGHDGPEVVTRTGPFVARVGPVDTTLQAAIRAFPGPRMAWIAPDEPAVVGVGETATIEADGPDRFEVVRREGSAVFDALEVETPPGAPDAARPRLMGGFAFHDDHEPGAPWVGFPGAQFVLPRVQLTVADGSTWLAVTATAAETSAAELPRVFDSVVESMDEPYSAGSPPPGVADLRRVPDRAGWREQVRAAIGRIEVGELEKVVLAQTLSARLRGSFRLAATLDRIGDAYPDCYRFGLDPGLGSAFFGATPERLVRRHGNHVATDAIAGSIGRGGTEAEDERLAASLESSGKVSHEHAVVVEALREQLSSVADTVQVGERTVRKLSNVQHLDSPVTAELNAPVHVLELVSALHPTPAVGGRPPAAAERLIATTEQFDRGWYAAPIGWFDADGDGTFAVGIRSGIATTANVTLYAGNGIVADSDPDEEWDELQLKYRPILDQLR